MSFILSILRNGRLLKMGATTLRHSKNGIKNKTIPELRPLSNKAKVTLFAFGVGVGCGFYLKMLNDESKGKLLPSLYAAQIFDEGNCRRSNNSKNFNFIADVVEKASPAVVYIEVISSYGYTQSLSNGSGFIVESDGLILTNAHVVGNSSQVKVQLHNGKVYSGSVETLDRLSDLATVRIQATGLPVLPLGRSSEVRTGEWVVALGSPLTLSNTVTAGVVSSIRPSSELGFPSKDMDFIQTDAAITFGNSGGPLVNLDGEAIGINSMKVTSGISFAIPSDYAARFLAQNKKGAGAGWFKRSSGPAPKYIGITMLTLSPSFIKMMLERNPDFPRVKEGIYVWRMVKDSPAHRAGLLPGDVIIHLNKQPVSSASEITQAVEQYDRLELTVYRGRQMLTFLVTPSS